MVSKQYKVRHDTEKRICFACCDLDRDEPERTPHKLHSLDIHCGIGSYRGIRIFDRWECQRCGRVSV